MENKAQKTKQCKKCKEEINIAAKKCPHCGAKQGIPKWVIAIIVFFILVAVASSGGESDSAKETTNDSKSTTDNSTKTEKKEKFSYTVENSYHDTFAYYIEGTVTNNRDRDYSYASIEFVCYDAEGNNLGTALDNTNNLLANQTWKYKAMFMGTNEENVDHCDYHEITGY